MMKKATMLLCLVLLLGILSGCSEHGTGATTDATGETEWNYPELQYLERAECRFDLDEITGTNSTELETLLQKGEPVATPEEGKQLAQDIYQAMQTKMGDFIEYIPDIAEYATEEKVWLFGYRTREVADGCNYVYVAVDGTDGSLIKDWLTYVPEPSGWQYRPVQYLEREECRFDLEKIEGAKNPSDDAFFSKGKPIQTPTEGTQLAEAFFSHIQSQSPSFEEYYAKYAEYSSKDQVWVFCYRLKEVAVGPNCFYVAVDGTDGSLILEWIG